MKKEEQNLRERTTEFAPRIIRMFSALPKSTEARVLGKPYFIQEWGYVSWNRAAASPITFQVVKEATATAIERLDASFFRVRFDRLTPGEKRFMRAMAGLGLGAHRSGDIAEALGVEINSIGPGRAKLIQKGMLFSPTHGDMAFTVPLFDQFMLRAMPEMPMK